MKILILGGSGMLGHKIYQKLKDVHDIYITFRPEDEGYSRYELFDEKKVIKISPVAETERFREEVRKLKPDCIINCIGIIKQQTLENMHIRMIAVNSLFPQRLALLCSEESIRMIQISTDCVFSGNKGNYMENDIPDAHDLYGRSKQLGEVDYLENVLTIRSSIIGRELRASYGLIEWFLAQEGKTVKGFKKAIFSGFTTDALTNIIKNIIENHADLNGLYHISADPICKYDLLHIVRDIYGMNIEIIPDEEFHCDRSLNSGRFREKTGFVPLPWKEMILEMFAGNEVYKRWRSL